MTARAPKRGGRREGAGAKPRAADGAATPLQVRLSAGERARLDAAAVAGGVSVSELVRDALEVYLYAHDAPARARYANAGDLIRVALEQLDPDDEQGELADLGREVIAVAERIRAR